jgi:hypothetical protein
MQKVRAKFTCNSVENHAYGGKTAKLTAVYSEEGENKDFAKATPSGQLEINIDQETSAIHFFEPGKDYYLDFSVAPKAIAD